LGDGLRFLRFVRRSRRRAPGNYTPPAALIIPCKGISPELDQNISRFLTQDYPSYQVIFVVASKKDPAFPHLTRRIEQAVGSKSPGERKVSLLVAGYSKIRGEKVNNLLEGLTAVDAQAEVLVFADADARAAPDWVRSLIAPLADPSIIVSTGFRWYLPGAGLVSHLRAAWDTSISTMLGDHSHNFAWGGSMAIRAADFKRLKVAELYWANTVSDDYAMTRAVREASGKIRFEPRCLVASREDSTFVEFLRWGNRQVIITRIYARRLWSLGLVSYSLYCGTFVLGVVLLLCPGPPPGERVGIATTLLAALFLGVAKGGIRTIVAREIFPEEDRALQRSDGCYWKLAWLVPWVMLINFVVAGFTRQIEWGGTRYELRSVNEVRVLRRRDS